MGGITQGNRNVLPTLTVRHPEEMVHFGKMHRVGNLFKGIVNSGSANFLIQTGTSEFNIFLGISADGPCYLYLYEGTFVSNSGTEITPVGNNRNVLTNITSKYYYTPTITTAGTLLGISYISGSTGGGPTAGGSATGGSIETNNEYILANTQRYTIIAVNTSGVPINIFTFLEFYEIP